MTDLVNPSKQHRIGELSCSRPGKIGRGSGRFVANGLKRDHVSIFLGEEDPGGGDIDIPKIAFAGPHHGFELSGLGPAVGQFFQMVPAEGIGRMLIGEQILKDARTPAAAMARDIALCHHEWWDGTGYPNGLSGEAIPEAARIVAILDVYDALVHDRVYRPAIPEEEALQMMKSERGRHFDPQFLDCFLQIVPELRRIREHVTDQGSPVAPEGHRADRQPLSLARAS